MEVSMKYMLLIHHDEQAWEKLSDAQRQPIFGEYMQLTQELSSRGQYLGGAPLQSTSVATSVRLRHGKRLVTDGPFAETREQLGGYFLIDTKDRDEAIGIAARIPAARWGTIEVRELVEVPVAAPTTA
jgi:hypothetical protein